MKENAKQKHRYKKFFGRFKKLAENYLNDRILLLKLQALEGLSIGVGHLVAAIFLMVSVLLFMLFAGVTLAIYLFEVFNNWLQAFGLVTAIFGILLIIILLAYHTIKKMAANRVINNVMRHENSKN